MSDLIRIHVMHFNVGSSDKIWAIDKILNKNGNYDVWWGARFGALTHDEFDPKPSFVEKKIREKERKGYEHKPTWTIAGNTLVFDEATDDQDEIPSTLWYRVSHKVLPVEVGIFINDAIKRVRQYDAKQAEHFEVLPTLRNLLDGELTGGGELQEGPFLVLLLFAMRRHFRIGVDPQSSTADLFSVANDDNEVLPDRYDDLGGSIRTAAESMLRHMGWYLDHEDIEVTLKKHGIGYYYSTEGLKDLAIAIGCMEAPVDLSGIETDIPSAYF